MITNNTKIVIFGAGGHAKVVADIIQKEGTYKVDCFIDNLKENQFIWNIPIISEIKFFDQPHALLGIVAIGDNFVREKVVRNIILQIPSFTFIKAIHPSAQIAIDTTIDVGTVVMANSIINPSSTIGAHCIVNSMASIDHDCIIEDYVSLAPQSCLGGNCKIGRGSIISIGAILLHNIMIGSDSLIGGGSLVNKNIPKNCVSYGSPAKVIRFRKSGEKYL